MQAAKEARVDKEAVTKFFRTVCLSLFSQVSWRICAVFLWIKNGFAYVYVNYLFLQLIRRRYYLDELQPSNPWSISPVQRSFASSDEITSSRDHYDNHTRYYVSSLIFLIQFSSDFQHLPTQQCARV